jgi:hypothetical protein
MEWIGFLAKSALVLLGIITILIGKYLSLKIITLNIEKYKVVDERNYVKYSRMIFYGIGFYYIVLGILQFINGWSGVVSIYGTLLLPVIVAPISRNRRKYIERIND